MNVTARLKALAEADPEARALVDRLVRLAVRGLPQMQIDGEFVFTVRGDDHGGLTPAGRSLRYAAITALGAHRLATADQKAALAGDTVPELVGRLVERLAETTGPRAVSSLGDAALVCWAAAETGHPDLAAALARLAGMDPPEGGAVFTVDAAWVLSALAAARGSAEVREHFERARRRLLDGVGAGSLFAHEVGGRGLVSGYRAHVGCFADQVYPIQALARAGDAEALAVADAAAAKICAAQGAEGQWWWHYDSRTGGVVEGYPVYSVHQHAMAPMCLLDLAGAGGADHLDAIVRGLHWMTRRPETAEPLIRDDLGLTWRKAARRDPKKALRGVRALTTRISPGLRLGVLDRVYPPVAVDRECRPYEFGWLWYAWLGGL